jgi:hypothetical protein
VVSQIAFLKLLEAEGLLDLLLEDFFTDFCVPHGNITVGLMLARTAYHEAGFELRLPADPFTVGPRFYTFQVAAVARLMEDDRMPTSGSKVLAIELRRLREAIDQWLGSHREAIEASIV